MLDQQGRLIGLASGVSGGKGYYIHLEEIRAFLQQQKLPWPDNCRAPALPPPSAAVANYVKPYGTLSPRPADIYLVNLEAEAWTNP